MSYSDTECPYCGAEQEINHDDGYGFDESRIYEQQCSDCAKFYTFTTSISYDYNLNRADCLNGAEHNYETTWTAPKCYTRMCCKDCDKERPLTEEEWLEFMAPMECINGWYYR